MDIPESRSALSTSLRKRLVGVQSKAADLTRAAALAFASATMFACANANPVSNEVVNEVPAVTFGWVDCNKPDQAHFSIDVWQSGRMRYSAETAARDLGEATNQVGKRGAQRLLKAAEKFISIRHAKALNESDRKGGERLSDQYCVTVAQNEGGHSTRAIASLMASSALRFNDVADEITGFRVRVCPARQLNFFGTTGACEVAPLMLVYDEGESSCRIQHAATLYSRGIIHYWVSGVENSDQFVEVSPRSVMELQRMAKIFSVRELDGAEEDPITHLGSDAELSQFRDALTNIAGIRWLKYEPGDTRCRIVPERVQLQRWIIM